MTQTAKAFNADLERINRTIVEAGALRAEADGFQWIDESLVPASLMRAYRGLVQYGYANGLMA